MGKSTVDASAKFGLRDKLAYAAGDFGCNMSFALKGYLTIYWTQFMGIDNYLMASLLLIVQIWDAINDPIIGAMVDADTHKYRRNKFLAYIWFGAIGLTVAGALCYLPFPQAPGMVKNILFVAGYMIWDAFYTVANVPYGSMLSLISDDPIQRAQLSTFRSIGSMGGGLLTGMLIPVIIYDNQNNLRGDVCHRSDHGCDRSGLLPLYGHEHKGACGHHDHSERGCAEVQRHEGVQQLYP